jgi:sugar O-acyltransferase (sialic acid O-acetyltransferase NeuD family)
MSKVILFGAGKIADVAYYYLKNDSEHEVIAFTVDRGYIQGPTKWGLPVVAFEEIERLYPPDNYKMFVAVGYQDLNKMRASKVAAAKAKSYELISYVCSHATNFGKVQVGENCFILENADIQPCATVGNDVFIWSGNHIGHHATIGDHCYFTGHVIVGGNTTIEPYCFLGMNATIGHEITIGQESFIGAGSIITKNVPPRSVYIAQDTPRFRLDSQTFLKLTKMK